MSLLCDGRRLKKKKTTIKKNTLNPVYNEAIIFDIPPENMDQVSLLISVMDYDRWVPESLSLTFLQCSTGLPDLRPCGSWLRCPVASNLTPPEKSAGVGEPRLPQSELKLHFSAAHFHQGSSTRQFP